MEAFQLINDLKKIPVKEYTGYYWMSDENYPRLVSKEKFNPVLKGNNPFIIGGNLFADDGSYSVSIEHIDGHYLIGIVKWGAIDKQAVVLEEETYLAHKAVGFSKVRFKRAWIPAADPECEGMEVLQPAWRAFTGFVSA